MIEGMDALFKKLEKYENLSLENPIGKAVDYVQSAAKNSCPVYDGKLRESILTATEQHGDELYGVCYTNTAYAPYVEMGTGPKGQKNHNGISTNVEVSYSQYPWWVHESQINQSVAEKYRWFCIDTPEGKFYQCSGQAAHPFMYPALKDHENEVTKIIGEDIRRQLK
jgi:HK97 gp10 family phage protein